MERTDPVSVHPPTPAARSNADVSPPAIKLGATLAALLLLLCIYGRWLIHTIPDPFAQVFRPLLSPFGLLTDFMNPVFPSPAYFFTLGTLCLALIVAALVRGKPKLVARIGFGAGILAILIAPLMVLVMYDPYRPYAKPAEGYEMQWITQPPNRFLSAFKSAQRAHEKHGCRYTLHGWDQDNVLYYGSDCDRKLWRYDPADQDAPRPVSALPSGMQTDATVQRIKNNIYPDPLDGFDRSTIYHFITTETAASPDGKFAAAAIQNMYGPGDVVVLVKRE
ncbi:MAG: hypothetical protein JXA89_03380 [Anaerolineae bacterium]|nr:hypothetical protein [Anaerolineae bacterium]